MEKDQRQETKQLRRNTGRNYHLGSTLEGWKTVLKRQTEKKKNLCVRCKLAGTLIILANRFDIATFQKDCL